MLIDTKQEAISYRKLDLQPREIERFTVSEQYTYTV